MRQERIEAFLFDLIEIAWSLAEGPQRPFELIVSFLGQVFLEALHFLLAQSIDGIAILARHMKAVDHNPCVRKHLLGGCDVAIPDIGTHRGDLGTDGGGNGLEPGDEGGFQAISKHRQEIQVAVFGLRTDDRHKVAMAFEERNLVDAQGCEWRQGIPINTLGDETVEYTEHGISGDILLGLNITQGAVDQLEDEMALVSQGM